ncbi:hypothetical protein IWQ60_010513 [Tieghemiomyces parasiticus]|uniref:Uncharacterized protein n=1 Tax=Tieghemiomyces parasiticus TaxID=78921 RepID=A0A9W7ZST1_9FUNG|nr:hypothetical protein IWQ60_010513 [Tieghemiomyces parasiticus]
MSTSALAQTAKFYLLLALRWGRGVPDRTLDAVLRHTTYRRAFAVWLVLVSLTIGGISVYERLRAQLVYFRELRAAQVRTLADRRQLLADHRRHMSEGTVELVPTDKGVEDACTCGIDAPHPPHAPIPSTEPLPTKAEAKTAAPKFLAAFTQDRQTTTSPTATHPPVGEAPLPMATNFPTALAAAVMRLVAQGANLVATLQTKSLADQPPEDYALIIFKRKVSQVRADVSYAAARSTDPGSAYASTYAYTGYTPGGGYTDPTDTTVLVRSELRSLRGILLNPRRRRLES